MGEANTNHTEEAGRPGELHVQPGAGPLPFIAEYPYFLWGEVNYDSEGDCSQPTDRAWRHLYLALRPHGPVVHISPVETAPETQGRAGLEVGGDLQHEVWLAAYLTALRTDGAVSDPETGASIPLDTLLGWVGDVAPRLAAADRIRAMFLDPKLAPFDSHSWWGGWKWVGEFSTDWTSGLRAIMNAVQTGHADAELCDWMRREKPKPFHRDGWMYALRVLGTTPYQSSPPPGAKPLPDWLGAPTPEATSPQKRPWWKLWGREER